MLKVEQVEAPACTLGEGPFWDAETSSLVYVDIFGGRLWRYWTESGRVQRLDVEPDASGSTVSFVVGVEGRPHDWLVGVGRTVGVVTWAEQDPDLVRRKCRPLVTVEKELPLNRFNDAKCDETGRLWAGTMGPESSPGVVTPAQGALYRFTDNMEPQTVLDKVDLSNGLAWSEQHFYYIDTCRLAVDRFSYDGSTGNIDNREKLVDYKTCNAGVESDLPDGMAIDTEGRLWVANYSGGKVICVEPSTGCVSETIPLPCRNPTSVCWGGEGGRDLYVTSSKVGLSAPSDADGRVFRVTGVAARGRPSVRARLDRAL